MEYQGSCHCGTIRYVVQMEQAPVEVTACNCSICQRRGHLLLFLPRANLQLQTSEADMTYYTFNTHRIKHYFCPTCGCAPFGMGTDNNGNETVAVNVRCLENIDIAALRVNVFDGRSL